MSQEPISLEWADMADRVPHFVRRVLHVRCGRGEVGRLLKERPGVEVYGVEQNPNAADDARTALDMVVEEPLPTAHLPFPKGYFDCIIASSRACSPDEFAGAFAKLAPLLTPEGCLLLTIPNPWYGGNSTEAASNTGPAPEEVLRLATKAGFVPYHLWHVVDPARATTQPEADARPASQQEPDELLTVHYHCMLVRDTYNPVNHGRALAEAGHPVWAYEVFSLIPESHLKDPEANAVVAVEMQLCLLAWDSAKAHDGRLDRFFNSQSLFYRAVSRLPDLHQAHQCQAEFWHRLGDDDMAVRLLRSIHAVAPSEDVQQQLETYPLGTHPRETDESVPDWPGSAAGPRILFLLPGRSHYGLDVLYDGLCAVLGSEYVTDFPWKPSLHGHAPEILAHYPCVFDRGGAPAPLDEILGRLQDGYFDMVLFGDVERTIDQGVVRRVLEAASGVPLFIVDQQDDPKDNREEVLDYLGRPSLHGYSKREYLACVDFGPNVLPLPFAYPDSRVLEDPGGPRPEALFWAGHRQFGLRGLYLDHLEKALARNFGETYAQDEYVDALRASRIGLNIFGFGFDTVRYWELPANGCMLLAERPPIRIPYNFEEGESAIFFDHVFDLEEKLSYYLSHTEEAAAIAQAGHGHLKRYHTGSGRARQLLAWTDEVLRREEDA